MGDGSGDVGLGANGSGGGGGDGGRRGGARGGGGGWMVTHVIRGTGRLGPAWFIRAMNPNLCSFPIVKMNVLAFRDER